MSTTNPQIDEQLDKLAELCCESLEGKQPNASDESEALLKVMLMSGYARMEGSALQQEIEARVELSAMTAELSKKFNELKRWESKQPEDRDKAKAANFSSATNS